MYAQDGTIRIVNNNGESILIARADAQPGKFHEAGDKEKEIPPRDLNDTEIKSNDEFTVNFCGRDSEPTDTKGTLDLTDLDDDCIATLSWKVPFWSKTNTFQVQNIRSGYTVTADGYNRTGSGLGTAVVKVVKG
ncbi:hypothetical protein EYZ11_002432 [Aspergillus tanneri]|uniref:Uncharacterized protein n=1 Tax=Aspergillus tanneri TaxID=1220188 RepID=A0A4S3JRI4_9EURO|nr:uncharacterized protein ATNIH1004_002039 [Aspergillus tanneri]XP_033430478.1 uncharacterized protein ATNIH1004_003810 [Aspergillus tanneri]KAA8641299.1 hypothetical protein ATNIH1004_002039 [Aspergillus tanneri]KAA8651117.1 hypothetical protein ATNIH1004_003810 [Aspergillus tanneri]THC98080.1 hypothetical protein EYZ11_002432 [Aspergillus tanneri]